MLVADVTFNIANAATIFCTEDVGPSVGPYRWSIFMQPHPDDCGTSAPGEVAEGSAAIVLLWANTNRN